MSFLDQVGEELEEESEHQQPDVHTVHIGIGSDDDFVVAELVESVFNIERRLQTVELFVLIHYLFGQSVAVKRFASQGEDGLGTYVAALGDGSGSG